MTREQVVAFRKRQSDDDLRNALGTDHGRRLLSGVIENLTGGTLTGTFCGEDTHRAAFLEGRRSIGVELLQECRRVSPADSAQMLTEAFRRQVEDQAMELGNG
jgi:hypothetical protein